VADRKTLLCWQVIKLLKNYGYFRLEFTEKRLRNRIVPPISHFDFSPVILLIILQIIERILLKFLS